MITNLQVFVMFFLFLLSIVSAMEYQDNGGHKIPVVGLGTFGITVEKELSNMLNKALEIGYRHIDTATAYNNEKAIGKVIKEWLLSDKIKREDMFITTKLSYLDLYPENVEKALNTSLQKLQLDYVDLYLIQFPVAGKINQDKKFSAQPTDLVSVWKKMEGLVDLGKAKTIGLSNFNISQIKRIQNIARIQPANLQVEVNAYFQQRELREFANKNNITIVAYSPLGSPGGYKLFKQPDNSFELEPFDVLNDSVVERIAKKHSKSNAQVLLKFLVQSDLVVIPNSTNPNELEDNIDVFNFTLDDDDMRALKSLDKGKKGKIVLMDFLPGITEHPEYPFRDNI